MPIRRVLSAGLSIALVAGLSLYFACLYQDDFRVYLAGAHDLFFGTLYSESTRGEFFTYPPAAALVFEPLARIPSPIAAQIVWSLLNDAALVALLGISIRAVRPDLTTRSRWLWAPALAAPAFFLEPVLLSVRNGQVNVLLGVLVLWDLVGSRRIGPLTLPLGVGTGVAAAVKLTPLIFLPYLLLTKRSRAGWRCAATFVVCEAVAFAAAPSSSAAYWTRYAVDYRRVGGYLKLDGLLATTNQSLMGTLARFNHGVVSSDVLWPAAVVIGVAGLSLAAFVHVRGSVFLGVVVCATTGLIVSPVTWTHHMVWVLPAILWLAAAPERPRWGRAVAAATAVVFWVSPVWWVPDVNLRQLHEEGWSLIAGNSFFIWMVLILIAIAAWAIWHGAISDTAESSLVMCGRVSTVPRAIVHSNVEPRWSLGEEQSELAPPVGAFKGGSNSAVV